MTTCAFFWELADELDDGGLADLVIEVRPAKALLHLVGVIVRRREAMQR
jgi:hypothetical protein